MTTQYQNKEGTFTPKKEDELRQKQRHEHDTHGTKEKDLGIKKPFEKH